MTVSFAQLNMSHTGKEVLPAISWSLAMVRSAKGSLPLLAGDGDPVEKCIELIMQIKLARSDSSGL